MTKDEFYVALRLIAYAQNGIRPDASSLDFDIEVDLPKFEHHKAILAAPPNLPSKP